MVPFSEFQSCLALHDGDFFGGEVVELVDEVVDLGFEGLDVCRWIGLLGREDAGDEGFDLLFLLGGCRFIKCIIMVITHPYHQPVHLAMHPALAKCPR